MVPSAYPDIQSALDVLAEGDTVLVEIGEYPEALTAPPLRFALIGEAEVDTGDFIRPVIDASLHPNNVHQGCLLLPPGSLPTIERIHFRNREGMSHRTDVGGVKCFSDTAVFRKCVFDSTYRGIYAPNNLQPLIIVGECVFREDSVCGIFTQSGTVRATNCMFSGGWNYAHIDCGPNSVIESCIFSDDYRYLLTTHGPGVVIRNCLFGPSGEHGFAAIALEPFSGVMSHCIFDRITLGPCVLDVEPISGDSAVFVGNTFRYNRATSAQGSCEISLGRWGQANGLMFFADNVITQCSTSAGHASGVGVLGKTRVERNQFAQNMPHASPVMIVSTSDSVTCQESIFFRNGIAMRSYGGIQVDARNNWWGDSTGPYHPQLNPDGLGDEVGDNILFDPWTQDTLEWVNAVEELPVIPEVFEMNVFPNPFNASAQIVIRVPQPEILRVELFDLLGRRVKELWSGAVAIEKTIRVDGTDLSSGVYFVRASEVIYRRVKATEKLVLMK